MGTYVQIVTIIFKDEYPSVLALIASLSFIITFFSFYSGHYYEIGTTHLSLIHVVDWPCKGRGRGIGREATWEVDDGVSTCNRRQL